MSHPSIVQRKRIGELLVEAEILRREELPIGLKEAERRSLRLGEVLVTLRYLSAEDLENVLQAQTRLNEGSASDSEAVGALRLAARKTISFDAALEQIRAEAADKKAQSELEVSILKGRLENIERTRGPFDKEIGTTCAQLGERLSELGDDGAAEEAYNRAVQIYERAYGPRHLKLVPVQTKLIELLQRQERFKDAESKCWRVIDITQGAWGENHPQVAQANRALARSLEGQYRLREAEQFYITALRITERVAGANSPEATDLLRHLANFWRKQGKKPEHRKLGDLLVEADLLSPDDLESALAYSRDNQCPLGQALVKMNRMTQDDLRPALQAQILVGDGVLPLPLATRALRLGRQGRSFEIALRELGWEPDVFTTEELNVLIDAAEELISAEAALGADHAGVAVLSTKLADIYAGQKRVTEAEPLYKRACDILERSFGPRDPELATALAKLAKLYLTDQRPQDAEPLISRALVIRRAVHGEKHLDVAECTDLLAVSYDRVGNLSAAEELYRAAHATRKELLSEDADRTVETEERLAFVLLRMGKLLEAEPIYRRLLAHRMAIYGPSHESLAVVHHRLGEIHFQRQELPAAEAEFKKALEIYNHHDKSSLSAAELMENFAALLDSMGKADEAKVMKERALTTKRLRG